MPFAGSTNKTIVATALTALWLLLSACGGSQPTTQPPATKAIPPSPTFTLPAGQPSETPADVTSAGEPTEITLGFTLGDPNLKATGPNTFVPASGEIQLVEFFAFW